MAATAPPTSIDNGTPVETVVTTPVALPANRYTVPGMGMIALGSGLGILEISKRPRRRASSLRRSTPAAGAGS